MPYVQVKVAGSLEPIQKKKIAAGITEILQNVAGKAPQSTYVVIEEVSRENWAVAGNLLSESS